jgi:glycosyltransferase involved in cell wall biosynthesis
MRKVVHLTSGEATSACQVLRLCSPLETLAAKGAISYRRVSVSETNESARACVEAVADADLVVVQRMCTWEFVRTLLARTLDRTAVIYETDDDLFSLPADHVLAERFAQGKDGVLRLMRRADAVTVTTEALALRMRAYAKRVYVLPNLIDERLWPASAQEARPIDAPIVIGYAGTFTHRDDLAFMTVLIARLRAAYSRRVRFVFFGCVPQGITSGDDVTCIEGGLTYDAYAKALPDVGFDIAIAPLEDTPFNRTKSAIKYLEYSRCRIPAVYARLDPYVNLVHEGETGLLAGSDPDEWFIKLRMLIDDRTLRCRIAEAAYADVASSHLLAPHADAWLSVYEDAVRFVRGGRVG